MRINNMLHSKFCIVETNLQGIIAGGKCVSNIICCHVANLNFPISVDQQTLKITNYKLRTLLRRYLPLYLLLPQSLANLKFALGVPRLNDVCSSLERGVLSQYVEPQRRQLAEHSEHALWIYWLHTRSRETAPLYCRNVQIAREQLEQIVVRQCSIAWRTHSRQQSSGRGEDELVPVPSTVCAIIG